MPRCAAVLKRSQRKCTIFWFEARRLVWMMGAVLLTAPALAGEISGAELDRLPRSDVVILGEVHDNPQHHVNQARAVSALQPTALVFEMLTPEQASGMPDDRSDGAAVAAALGWEAAGWPDFAMYHPIFTAAPDAAIFGADLSEEDVRSAVSNGAALVFGREADRFGLTTALSAADQVARQSELLAAHCNALPTDLLPGMVEVQRLRDATLARAIVAAVAVTGGPVAVITGTGHARRDQGIPAVLARAAPNLSVLSVGQVEGPARPVEPFDLWIVTQSPARGDPCAAFGTEAQLRVRPPEMARTELAG